MIKQQLNLTKVIAKKTDQLEKTLVMKLSLTLKISFSKEP